MQILEKFLSQKEWQHFLKIKTFINLMSCIITYNNLFSISLTVYKKKAEMLLYIYIQISLIR